MSEDAPLYDGDPVRAIERDPDPDRVLWLAIRRGLLVIVRAIEARYARNDERVERTRRPDAA